MQSHLLVAFGSQFYNSVETTVGAIREHSKHHHPELDGGHLLQFFGLLGVVIEVVLVLTVFMKSSLNRGFAITLANGTVLPHLSIALPPPHRPGAMSLGTDDEADEQDGRRDRHEVNEARHQSPHVGAEPLQQFAIGVVHDTLLIDPVMGTILACEQ